MGRGWDLLGKDRLGHSLSKTVLQRRQVLQVLVADRVGVPALLQFN